MGRQPKEANLAEVCGTTLAPPIVGSGGDSGGGLARRAFDSQDRSPEPVKILGHNGGPAALFKLQEHLPLLVAHSSTAKQGGHPPQDMVAPTTRGPMERR